MLKIDLRELIVINQIAKKYLKRMQVSHEKQYKTEEKKA
jgi:CBS domain containing-hemolysin-like protein